jgi:3-oxoacyl-[acyl-carrier protein] reductase
MNLMPVSTLESKNVLVAAGAKNLGGLISRQAAEAGANVAIHDLDWTRPSLYGEFADLGESAKGLEKHGTRVTAVTGNIGDREAVAEMKRRVESDLGDVHVLVNCAGGDIGAKGVKPSPNNGLDIDYDDIKVLTENNLIGTMLVCQAFIPPMVKRGSGSVINIASAAAHIGCSPEVVYSTLKAAVVHYTRCLAKELYTEGVRVNAVSPGPTKTARFQATRVTDPAKMDSNTKSFAR